MKWLLLTLGALALWFANRALFRLMDDSRFTHHFGIPTLFLLLCMGAVGWVGRNQKKKFVQRPLPWVATWASIGFSVAGIVATIAWMIGANLPYNNFDLLWPFSFGLAGLDNHPSIMVVLLAVTVMGSLNGLYYAFLAVVSWMLWWLAKKLTKTERRNSGTDGKAGNSAGFS